MEIIEFLKINSSVMLKNGGTARSGRTRTLIHFPSFLQAMHINTCRTVLNLIFWEDLKVFTIGKWEGMHGSPGQVYAR